VRFVHEIWLYLIPLLLLLWMFLRWSDQRSIRKLETLLGARSTIHIEKHNSRLQSWRRFLFFGSLVWLFLGLASPQWGAKEVVVTAEGSDIVIVLDISQSMLVSDVPPTRLGAVKTELGAFLGQLQDSRIGLVFFSGMAAVQNPLTLDYGITAIHLEKAHPGMMSDRGTNVGAGLKVARELLAQSNDSTPHGNFQAIILVTDGEDWGGTWHDEATACKKAGIKVIPVGVGTQAGGPIPVLGTEGTDKQFIDDPDRQDGTKVLAHFDSAFLDELAAIDGGSSFRIGEDGLAGKRLFSVLNRLGKRELQERRVMSYQDRSVWAYLLSFFSLALSLAILPRKSRREGLVDIVGRVVVAVIFMAVFSGDAVAGLKTPGHDEANAGRDKYLSGDFEGALSEFDAAMVLAPDDARVSLARGETLYQLERYEEAGSEFLRAQSLATDDELRSEALYNHGTTQLQSGDPGAAIEKFREALIANPGQEDILYNLELAMKLQQQQQQQKQEQQQDENSENQDQEEDQEQDQQEQQEQEKSDQGQENQENEQQDSEQEQQEQEQQQQEQQDQEDQEDQEGQQPEESEEEQQQSEETEHPSEEELNKEQALQLLKALDHDEEEQIKAMQKRLKGKPGSNKKQW
jgi:Ca-activated chloride channel homolog